MSPTGCERILLIDDEEALVRSGRLALEILGYKVSSITNPVDALETFQANPEGFDLVITDQTMPKLTDIDLAKEMLQPRPELPIILYTGYSDNVNEQTARDAGIQHFVMKPVAFEELAHVVRRVQEPQVNAVPRASEFCDRALPRTLTAASA